MIVDAAVYVWTQQGMRRISETFVVGGARYIEVTEAERLLEDAHRRGRRSGIDEALMDASVARNWNTEMGR